MTIDINAGYQRLVLAESHARLKETTAEARAERERADELGERRALNEQEIARTRQVILAWVRLASAPLLPGVITSSEEMQRGLKEFLFPGQQRSAKAKRKGK
jgi:hypothetical protein